MQLQLHSSLTFIILKRVAMISRIQYISGYIHGKINSFKQPIQISEMITCKQRLKEKYKNIVYLFSTVYTIFEVPTTFDIRYLYCSNTYR